MAAATICVILKKETARRMYRHLSQDNRTLTREEALEVASALAQYFGPSELIPEKKQQQEEP